MKQGFFRRLIAALCLMLAVSALSACGQGETDAERAWEDAAYEVTVLYRASGYTASYAYELDCVLYGRAGWLGKTRTAEYAFRVTVLPDGTVAGIPAADPAEEQTAIMAELVARLPEEETYLASDGLPCDDRLEVGDICYYLKHVRSDAGAYRQYLFRYHPADGMDAVEVWAGSDPTGGYTRICRYQETVCLSDTASDTRIWLTDDGLTLVAEPFAPPVPVEDGQALTSLLLATGQGEAEDVASGGDLRLIFADRVGDLQYLLFTMDGDDHARYMAEVLTPTPSSEGVYDAADAPVLMRLLRLTDGLRESSSAELTDVRLGEPVTGKGFARANP